MFDLTQNDYCCYYCGLHYFLYKQCKLDGDTMDVGINCRAILVMFDIWNILIILPILQYFVVIFPFKYVNNEVNPFLAVVAVEDDYFVHRVECRDDHCSCCNLPSR